ncbi:hypothetical protein [Treponema pedis]|uniref:hypothetical protein n=1 Tax=Treponema pedis TaxID=409322 RepID=UPI0003F7A500|nr:hypothetical protein [Treponema pedis]
MKKRYFILTAFSVISLLLSSCTTAGSGRIRVMTSYMENSYMKYYIRPGKMLSADFKTDKAFVNIDFSYQKDTHVYVTDAYTNFTLNYKTSLYIKEASFLLANNETVNLLNIKTLDRNVNENYIRVSTILKKENLQNVLEALAEQTALLEVTLEDGTKKRFTSTSDLSERIKEAFAK